MISAGSLVGKSWSSCLVAINVAVWESLSWLSSTIPKSIRICFVDSGFWTDSEADMCLLTDAAVCINLAFVFPENGLIYSICPPSFNTPVDIFFLKLLSILFSIHFVATSSAPPKCLLIQTDSLDSVRAFSSLHTSQHYTLLPFLLLQPLFWKPVLTFMSLILMVKRTSKLIQVRFPHDHVCTFIPHCELLLMQCREYFWTLWVGHLVCPVHLSLYPFWMNESSIFNLMLSNWALGKDILQALVITLILPNTHTLSWSHSQNSCLICCFSLYIVSVPKYLSSTCHFLCHLYPTFDENWAHPFVQSTIAGSKKLWADPICCKLPACLAHLHSFLNIAISTQKYDDLCSLPSSLVVSMGVIA